MANREGKKEKRTRKNRSHEVVSEGIRHSDRNVSGFRIGLPQMGCNKWGLKGSLAALPGNRPFRPFSAFSGGCEEHLDNPENGGKRPFYSDILRFA